MSLNEPDVTFGLCLKVLRVIYISRVCAFLQAAHWFEREAISHEFLSATRKTEVHSFYRGYKNRRHNRSRVKI